MNTSVLFLFLLNFLFIGSLPYLFFRQDGQKNPLWWLTATPFFLCVAFLLAGYGKFLQPLIFNHTWTDLLAVSCSVGSIALIAFTLGTHRFPLSLWHQDNDAPKHIVTYGAYAKIRHPFYSAFLLALLGALIFFPHLGTFLTFIGGFMLLNFTAAKEERRLLVSQFGNEYKAYLQQTGRFLPIRNSKLI